MRKIIRDFMKKKGWTPIRFAAEIGLKDAAVVGLWLSEDHAPSATSLIRMRQIGVPLPESREQG